MKLYIVCAKQNGNLNPVGIATSEERAKARLTDGEYIVIPVQPDVYYGTEMISEGAPGAITYRPQTDGIKAAVDALTAAVDKLRADAMAAIQADRARLTAIETQLSEAATRQ